MTYNQNDNWGRPLDQYQEVRKTGKECFYLGLNEFPEDLLSFWQWADSDLLHRRTRGILAEYIVALAVGSPLTVRIEYHPYDVKTPSGIEIEVKASSALRSEGQKDKAVKFSIGKTRIFDRFTGTTTAELKRHSDIYIFCVIKHLDKRTVDPLNLEQWDFYVVPTYKFNEKLPNQKTILLSALIKKLNPEKCSFNQIESVVEKMGKLIKQIPV